MAFRHSATMYRSVVLLVLAAGITPAAAADQSPATEDPLKPKLLALLPESKPPKPIARTLQTEEWQVRGISGKRFVHSRSLFVPQEAGLVRMESANSAGSSLQAVLVCGLIALQNSGFSPGGDASEQSRSRVTGFETNSAIICRPSPGAEFSYRLQIERHYRVTDTMTGLFSTKGTKLETHDVLCKAEDAHIPAREILRSLEGNALLVRCEDKSHMGVGTFEYAFLPESGFYLRLRDQGRGRKVEVRYTEIRYRD